MQFSSSVSHFDNFSSKPINFHTSKVWTTWLVKTSTVNVFWRFELFFVKDLITQWEDDWQRKWKIISVLFTIIKILKSEFFSCVPCFFWFIYRPFQKVRESPHIFGRVQIWRIWGPIQNRNTVVRKPLLRDSCSVRWGVWPDLTFFCVRPLNTSLQDSSKCWLGNRENPSNCWVCIIPVCIFKTVYRYCKVIRCAFASHGCRNWCDSIAI